MNKNIRVMFDNAGGITIDFDGYKFFYQDCKMAAEEYQAFISGDTDDFDLEQGDKNLEIYDGKDPNGGHKTIDNNDINDLVNGDESQYYWGFNEECFIKELKKIRRL